VAVENNKPIIKVLVNNKYTAVCDELDRPNCTDEELVESLE
jgi:hypothetical protein